MTFSLTYQYALFAIIPPTPQLKGFIRQLISFLAGDLFAYSPSIITCSSQVRIASIAVEQPEKTANTLWHHHWFPREMTSEKWAQKFHTDDVASDWPNHMGNLLQPIRSTTQIWVVTRHQYGEFLCSFLRRHFMGKSVVTSQSVVCFLRLAWQALVVVCFFS